MAESMQRVSSGELAPQPERQLIAPPWHTAAFVLLIAGLSVVSYLTSRQFVSGAGSQSARLVAYSLTLVEEWALFLYVYLGMRARGMTVRQAVNARWSRPRDVWRDIGIALIILVLFFAIEGISSVVFRGANSAASKILAQLTPHTLLEALLWTLLSLSAGFCEEFLFRGYLQEQFRRVTGSAAAGIVLQALLFGGAHGYQGWALMLTIFFIGLLFGIFAAWRKSLAPLMITHGAADTISGVAAFVAHAMHRM